MYTYLIINILTISLPIALSFESKVRYVKYWKYLFPSLLITAIFFLVWDYYFTLKGVWGFNSDYLIGIKVFDLPIEEILFFFCIPFSCLFIYELVCHFQKRDIFGNYLIVFIDLFIALLIAIAVLNIPKIYTSLTSLLLALLLVLHRFYLRSQYLNHFFHMYIISFLPFLIVNGLLTNGLRSIHNGPVVWYDDQYNLSLRVLNIPVEDFMYSMLLLLLNVTLYEYFKKKCVTT